jgi:superfamily II DNA or RNA helicase
VKFKAKGYLIRLIEATDAEVSFLNATFTWYVREGTLKDLLPEDYIKPSQGSKRNQICKVTRILGNKVYFREPGSPAEQALPIFQVTRMVQIRLVWGSLDNLKTYKNLYSLIKKKSPYPVELVDDVEPTPKDRLKLSELQVGEFSLYPYQVAAINAAVTHKSGILVLPTSAGKTLCAIGFLKTLLDRGDLTSSKRAVVVVPTTALIHQFVDDFKVEPLFESRVSSWDGRSKKGNLITVATFQSLASGIKANDPKTLELLEAADTFVIDEGHGMRSESVSSIVKHCHEYKFKIAMTGSPFLNEDPTKDPGDAMVWAMSGGPIFSIDYKFLIDNGYIAEPVMCFKPIGSPTSSGFNFQKVYDENIVQSRDRNLHIVKSALEMVKWGHQVLILVQRLEHARTLMEALRQVRVVCAFGGSKGLIVDPLGQVEDSPIDYDSVRYQVAGGEIDILIGSSALDTGFNIPSIGAVILAGGGKSAIKSLQRLGRGVRKKKSGLNRVYVLDYMDKSHGFLLNHSRTRLHLYKQVGATILTDDKEFWRQIASHNDKEV